MPLAVKLTTIESFIRAEMTKRIKLTRRDRASQGVQEEATVDVSQNDQVCNFRSFELLR